MVNLKDGNPIPPDSVSPDISCMGLDSKERRLIGFPTERVSNINSTGIDGENTIKAPTIPVTVG